MKAGRIILVLMAAFAVVVLATTAYVTAYVSLGKKNDWRLLRVGTNQVDRHYQDREWCLTVFAPAAAVESKWIGCPVYLTHKRAPPLVNVDTGLL